MPLALWLRGATLGLAGALFGALVQAAEPCRVAYDLGSSGIRVGASTSSLVVHADLDYLGPLWAGRGLDETILPTLTALQDLPRRGGFAADCARVGGGFSAWRLALQQDAGRLAAALAQIREQSGVAILVIPQAVEGAYGYQSARQLLGDRLNTSHVLDIGGGSLQIAGERDSWGDALGQKIWHRELCRELGKPGMARCQLQPMAPEELIRARAFLTKKLVGVRAALADPVTMTAISRPVARGVLPAVKKLRGADVEGSRLGLANLSAAIEQLAALPLEKTAALLGHADKHLGYLLSDMLLVEGLIVATGGHDLQVAEIDLTNLPGLIADTRAYDWSASYACYLERLRTLGLAAYASDPATCAAP